VPAHLGTNRYAGPGTIVKTGPNSVASVGTVDGNSVLIAPETTVRITRTGIEVLEAPDHPTYIPKNGRKYKVRTGCGGAVAARG
jgi:hypothetical protein